jgi:hypothetical protein
MKPSEVTCPSCSQDGCCYDRTRSRDFPEGIFHSSRIRKAERETEAASETRNSDGAPVRQPL